MAVLSKAADVIEALGGAFQVGSMVLADVRVVMNWQQRGVIPPKRYWQLKKQLERRRIDFDPVSVFGFEPEPTQAEVLEWHPYMSEK